MPRLTLIDFFVGGNGTAVIEPLDWYELEMIRGSSPSVVAVGLTLFLTPSPIFDIRNLAVLMKVFH